jgi:hypothetical protein
VISHAAQDERSRAAAPRKVAAIPTILIRFEYRHVFGYLAICRSAPLPRRTPDRQLVDAILLPAVAAAGDDAL